MKYTKSCPICGGEIRKRWAYELARAITCSPKCSAKLPRIADRSKVPPVEEFYHPPSTQSRHLRARLTNARKKLKYLRGDLDKVLGVNNTRTWENNLAAPGLTNFIRWANFLGYDVKLVRRADKNPR